MVKDPMDLGTIKTKLRAKVCLNATSHPKHMSAHMATQLMAVHFNLSRQQPVAVAEMLARLPQAYSTPADMLRDVSLTWCAMLSRQLAVDVKESHPVLCRCSLPASAPCASPFGRIPQRVLAAQVQLPSLQRRRRPHHEGDGKACKGVRQAVAGAGPDGQLSRRLKGGCTAAAAPTEFSLSSRACARPLALDDAGLRPCAQDYEKIRPRHTILPKQPQARRGCIPCGFRCTQLPHHMFRSLCAPLAPAHAPPLAPLHLDTARLLW